MQSMLNAAGADAGRILGLWWFFLVMSIVVFVVVLGFLARGLMVRREITPEGERAKVRAVVTGIGITVVVLIGILFSSVAVGRSTVMGPADALTIEVTGHQWWWEVRYLDPSPHRSVTTANEINLPVGQRIRFLLRSQDVIHSFWIPSLGGKLDMFPDRTTTLWLEPTRTGVFRGQCAEFCGMQHGHMAFTVVVREQADFEAWLEREREPAAEPADELAQRGREVVTGGTCGTCHRIRGTEALGTLGPDLTHLASRRTLAAGSMPNDRARLAAWLVDPQRMKPGSLMPPTQLPPDDLQAVLHYLEQLR